MLQNKNFIVLLSDQSPGAKIGQKSAAVVNITNGKPLRAVFTVTPMCYYFTYTTYMRNTLTTCVETGTHRSLVRLLARI